MRFLVRIVVIALCLALGFAAGRFTAAPPQYQLAESTGDADDLPAAFEDFLRAQRETMALMQASPLMDDPQMAAEAYRGLLYTVIGSVKAGALIEHDFPRFMRAVDWTSKSGLDNPDNNYYIALIRDDVDYVIRGQRGTTRDLVFQVVVGQPGVRGAGTSTNVSVLEGTDLLLNPNGEFQIVVSRDDPGPGVNWLPSGDGAETIIVRMTHSDWETERAGWITIDPTGEVPRVKPVLTPAAMAEALRDAAVHMYDRTATWLKYAEMAWVTMPRNGVSNARPSQGGLVGQWSAFGSWDLADDQAIVLRAFDNGARYQGIELGNRWFVSLDYETRTSTLTLDQAVPAGDGSYYFVISARDPGVANWLDTESHRSGLILMRWQGLEGDIADDQQPQARLVDWSELASALPPNTVRVTPQEREAQARQRRLSVLRRDR